MYRLQGVIQHYAWGGNHFLSALLNQDNSAGKPYAEYWLGVHPGGPSVAHLGEGGFTQLSNLISSDRNKHLGRLTRLQFNGLPFLLKILDVKDMLSIQVHPNKERARLGFEKEEALGIELSAANRNYKDQNHKPEVMVALSDFWLLHGFAADIELRLHEFSFLQDFLPVYQSGGIKNLFEYLLNLSKEQSNEILAEHAARIVPLYQQGLLKKESPDFWAARAMLNFCSDGDYDKGIFSIYLMNILHLQPGEGIFQGAGLLHAYLEGQNVELMSNSDNVLRAGLTPKHIDVQELMANTDFVITNPIIIRNSLNKTLQNYPCETVDFSIQKISLDPGERCSIDAKGPSVLLQLKGEVELSGNNQNVAKGLDAFFIDASEQVECYAKASTDLFIASVPV